MPGPDRRADDPRGGGPRPGRPGPARLQEVHQVLCTRSEDRHRADALLATVVEEHGDW
ncbi:hypothetical protein [Streptomyces sp. NPDC052701]|uniref:hypothetical protein n=1 Tax=Streptomyces sp. NPDC052701 TaxID=3155533 RepID=UPI00341A0F02